MVVDHDPFASQSLIGDPMKPVLQIPMTPAVPEAADFHVAFPVVVSKEQEVTTAATRNNQTNN